MIDSRWSSITFGLVAALMLAGCSKTEDTAPERRVFGSPPAIESVSVVATQDTVSCDFTAAFDCALINDPCSFDYNADPFQCPVTDPTNPAYDFDGPNIVHVTPGPLMIGGTYTKVHFEVKATDPESTPGHSDILLVSATYPVPDAKGEHPENTIVLLDDGSHQSFPFTQRGGVNVLEAGTGTDGLCVINEDGTCLCNLARYTLNSNDVTEADNIFTRNFALTNIAGHSLEGFFADCLARKNHQPPFPVNPGQTFTFRIDAVDRSGNVTTWPVKPTIAIPPRVDGQTNSICTGDDCLCCILRTGDIGQCKTKTGLVGPETPRGACIDRPF